MKYFFIVFLLFLSTGIAQKQSITPEKDRSSQEYHPIDGTPFLEAQNKEVNNYFRENPDALTQQKLNKTQSWGFTVGTNKSFYAYNFITDTRYSTAFTCRAVGNNCYIFVEDSLWGTRVFQPGVDSVLTAFDSRTPANPSLGIYQMELNAFGNPPDVDNDPRIVILILNIIDGFIGSGGYIAGYFSSYNELPSTTYPQSNTGEFYYVDGNPLNLTTPNGIQTAMSTAAHEFQHMINFNYHQSSSQLTFINESCSMLAELYCGYPSNNQSLYGNESNHYLFDWRTVDNPLVLNDYSRAQKFSLYLWDQFGIGIFRYIVQTQIFQSVPLINYSLQQIGQSLNFNDVFINWLLANSLNDTTINRSYGYAYPNIYKSHSTAYYNPNVSGGTTLDNLAAEYITFANGSNLNITFNTASASIIVKAIEIGSGTNQVVDVPLNSMFSIPEFGTTYSSVTFVIINTDQNTDQNYTFTSSGTVLNIAQELKWDTTEPTGYYIWSSGDTVAVQFNAYPGARLDSIRVALRRAGSITGGVWEFTGTSRPTPLGKNLASPITASISTETSVPYPVPYQNWTTVDLRSYSITTDKDFVVGFVIGKTPNTPGVMVTDYPSTDPYHSYTYLNAPPGGGDPDWYYISSGTAIVAIYLIRAYVSLVTSAGTETAVELTPVDFSLGQNYPNPFNPSTRIQYQVSGNSHVTLKIYNVLGTEVATLVNEEKEAGYHSVDFNESELPSGVYFYGLRAGNFIDTKKMLLLK